jgi:hypothetical protein
MAILQLSKVQAALRSSVVAKTAMVFPTWIAHSTELLHNQLTKETVRNSKKRF